MRLCFALLALLIASRASAQGTGTIAGQVLEDDGVTTVIGANVQIDGTNLGATTDIDGTYQILGVPVGVYNVTASGWGDDPHTRANVVVVAGQTARANFVIEASYGYEPLTLEPPMFTEGAYNVRIVYGWEIEQMPLNR